MKFKPGQRVILIKKEWGIKQGTQFIIETYVNNSGNLGTVMNASRFFPVGIIDTLCIVRFAKPNKDAHKCGGFFDKNVGYFFSEYNLKLLTEHIAELDNLKTGERNGENVIA